MARQIRMTQVKIMLKLQIKLLIIYFTANLNIFYVAYKALDPKSLHIFWKCKLPIGITKTMIHKDKYLPKNNVMVYKEYNTIMEKK